MQEKLFKIIKDNLGSEFLKTLGTVYNIFPKHIPNGAIDNNFSSACVYNIVQAQVKHTLTLYSVQITCFNLNYKECRRIAVLVKKLFNDKNYSDETTGFLSSTVNDMIELEYDIETGMYGVAVNLIIKTALDW